MFKETLSGTVKMDDSSDSDVSPYVTRVMTNNRMLDVLSELASSIQVSTDKYVCRWPLYADISYSYALGDDCWHFITD